MRSNTDVRQLALRTKPLRVILHVDMDAFYPSVEVLRNSSLRGLPVIVGADPQGGKGRGVVTSCSYEARKFGVRSAMPISQAFRLCPSGIYLRPDFELYGIVSERVMNILRKHAAKFEQVSIDEAFLDISENVSTYEEVEDYAIKVKGDVLEAEGLTCSVGVAPNKSIAKIASDHRKPDGLTIVRPEQVKEFLAPLPVRRVSGVGEKTQELLKALGIETVGQLAKYPSVSLVEKFGKNGVWLWEIANGLEQAPVEDRRGRKSIGSEQTFQDDVLERDIVLKALDSLVDEVSGRAASEGVLFKTVGIKIRFKDFQTFSRERSFPRLSDDRELVRKIVHDLFDEFRADKRSIRLVGVRVSHLRSGVSDQPPLDSWA